ncbi:MAG: hypothetical protein IPL84_18110 [Chitinophagaceae bacterium]|nr:hypothetical protein [Chitinophagaceae bacterium]
MLQWITENELNADIYIVERSTDGINYAGIGTVNAYNTNKTGVAVLQIYCRYRD